MSNYDENVKKWKKAYTEILDATDNYQDFDNLFGFRDIRDIRSSAKDHLLLIEWYENYGLKLDHDNKPYSHNHIKYSEYIHFDYFRDAEAEKERGSGRFISWSDDGRQLKHEWLFGISFPTGAYIFGDDYKGQQQLFQDFIQELKGFKPDYSDTVNKSFYWKLENAKSIFEKFNTILQKYRDRNHSEFNARKAERLREELAKLEPNNIEKGK